MNYKKTFDIIHSLTEKPHSHALWVNTLSYLEYSGSRKIIKNISSSNLDSKYLLHLKEEIFHAHLLKNIATKLNPKLTTYSEDHTFKKLQFVTYFKNLEKEVLNLLGEFNSTQTYLTTTRLIEERAIWIYELYKKSLAIRGINVNLKIILTDEKKHLKFQNAIDSTTELLLKKREEELYSSLISSIEQAYPIVSNQGDFSKATLL